jgi:hypothetical protein
VDAAKAMTIVLTGERRDGKFRIYISGIYYNLTYTIFQFLIDLVLNAISQSRFTPLPSSHQEAILIRVTVCRLRKTLGRRLGAHLIQSGVGTEYQLNPDVAVAVDPSFFDLPPSVVRQDVKEKLGVLPHIVIHR